MLCLHVGDCLRGCVAVHMQISVLTHLYNIGVQYMQVYLLTCTIMHYRNVLIRSCEIEACREEEVYLGVRGGLGRNTLRWMLQTVPTAMVHCTAAF